jgi:hypothetical protein
MNTAVCEFGHLLQRIDRPPFGAWWGHVHEDDALSCAVLVDMGWPDPRLARR